MKIVAILAAALAAIGAALARHRKTAATTGLAGVLAAAAAFVGPWEGLETRAYRDIVGVWTICYGHTEGVRPGDASTPEACASLLATDLAAYHARLAACIPGLPAQPEPVQVALVSWAYNVGTGAACASTLARLANAADWRGACDQLPRWNRAGGKVVNGLTRRRAAEQALCLSGV